MQVAVLGVKQELLARLGLDRVSHSIDSAGEPLEDSLHITSLLHGDDPELILLIDPDQEGFGSVVEDTTALRPLPLHAGGNQILVSRDKEEMVIHQLLADILLKNVNKTENIRH